MPKVWKIAPGTGAVDWEACCRYKCIGLGWTRLSDFRRFEGKSKEDVFNALHAYRRRGELDGNGKGAARSIWYFLNEVKRGHIIVANEGRGAVVGIGLVTSGYLAPGAAGNPIPEPNEEEMFRRHARRVDWVVRAHLELPDSHFFGIDTVTSLAPDKVREIRKAYRDTYPSLRKTLDRLFRDALGNESTAAGTGDDFAAESDIEGVLTEVVCLKRSRSRKLRNSALRQARGVCCVCNRDYSQLLGGRGVRVLQVHHREQLSARNVPVATTVGDLAVVCANCHMLLHLDPEEALGVDDLREMLERDGFLTSS